LPPRAPWGLFLGRWIVKRFGRVVGVATELGVTLGLMAAGLAVLGLWLGRRIDASLGASGGCIYRIRDQETPIPPAARWRTRHTMMNELTVTCVGEPECRTLTRVFGGQFATEEGAMFAPLSSPKTLVRSGEPLDEGRPSP